jgi:hypothetical protein
MKRLAVLLALAASAHAGGYENTTLGYLLDVPAGWETTSKPDAPAAVLTHAGTGMSVRFSGAVRGGALGAPEIERLKATDEAALKKRIAQYKSAPFNAPATIGGCNASHYGFVYRDEKAQVMVSRFAAFSRSRGADHVWMKINAVFPKAAMTTATPAFESLLASLKWKEAASTPTPAVVESAPPKVTPEQFVAENTTPPPAKTEPASTAGTYSYSKYVKPTNKKDAQRFENSFKPNAQPRTAEEQARAREFGLGGTFSPGR